MAIHARDNLSSLAGCSIREGKYDHFSIEFDGEEVLMTTDWQDASEEFGKYHELALEHYEPSYLRLYGVIVN